MKITIIGWYGTETIGDRAILAGLISLFSKSFPSFEINLGSLYPFFSERTISEDFELYTVFSKQSFNIKLFNSKQSQLLNKAIKNSDLLIMGGGPLMDLDELFMIEYAFKKAQKIGVKTALLGCGVGPLFDNKYQKSVLEIARSSDLIILRDHQSKLNLINISEKYSYYLNVNDILVSFDPAVECSFMFNNTHIQEKKQYIAINLRSFPVEYTQNKSSENINRNLHNFVNELADLFVNNELKLIPMHYFHIGGDDRVFLNEIAFSLNKNNICVQNKNLTLEETLQMYQSAWFNVGMRFHAVVLQTLVSRYNYILDYTVPNEGKISGFINDIDNSGFYSNRYVNLQNSVPHTGLMNNLDNRFSINTDYINMGQCVYISQLKKFSN